MDVEQESSEVCNLVLIFLPLHIGHAGLSLMRAVSRGNLLHTYFVPGRPSLRSMY